VAEIRLRNINREYILKRVEETAALEDEIADLEDTLGSSRRIRKIISDELKQIIKKYPAERRTGIVYAHEVEEFSEELHVEDYTVNLFLSEGGYFKKITPLSLRMGGEQKYKEGDGPFQSFEAQNAGELLVFTDKQQVYKARVRDFEDTKASALGNYLPAFLGMDEGESALYMLDPGDYGGQIMLFFANGKCARLELSTYSTKSNRKKLTGAYSAQSPLVSILQLREEGEVAVTSTEGRAIIFNTALLSPKTSRSTQGVGVMNLKPKFSVESARFLAEAPIKNAARYRVRSVPAAGALLRPEDRGEEQLTMSS